MQIYKITLPIPLIGVRKIYEFLGCFDAADYQAFASGIEKMSQKT